MPVTLVSAKIRGVRSYSPFQHKTQSIDFMPLTLIVGPNGSGKTTIIEALKFIMSGEEPPLSDSRRNFLHTTNKPDACFDKKTSYAQVEVEFYNNKDEICFARRDICRPTGAKTSTPAISSSFKIGNRPWADVYKQDDWQKTIPLMFNFPNQAILNKVVLCHQEDNLWCMGESSSVKQIFDAILGCEKYKKEIKHIDAELKACKSDKLLAEKEFIHTKERAEAKKNLRKSIISSNCQIQKVKQQISMLEADIEVNHKERNQRKAEISSLEQKVSELKSLQEKAKDLAQKEKLLLKTFNKPVIKPQDVSDAELEDRIQNHSKLVNEMKEKQNEIKCEKNKLETKLKVLRSDRTILQEKLNKLKVMELKSQETFDSLITSLKNIKLDSDMQQVQISSLKNCETIDDIKKGLPLLDKLESDLLQNKSQQCELEDTLAGKQQEMYRSMAELEGTHQGLTQKIRNKETFVKKLNEQLSKAEPMLRDLTNVSHNLERIESLCNQMPSSELVLQQTNLVLDTRQIVTKLVKSVSEKELDCEIVQEEREIQSCKDRLDFLKEQKENIIRQQAQSVNDHNKARVASKEAHNRAVVFKNAKSNILTLYSRYESERKLLKDKNTYSINEELQKLDIDMERSQNEIRTLDFQSNDISRQLEESFELYEEYKSNSQLRKLMVEIDQVSYKIMSYEGETTDLVTLDSLKSKLSSLELEGLELNRKQSHLEGTIIQLGKEVHRFEQDLKNYSKANRQHAEVLGAMASADIIIKDLEKLKECFQTSIITFHNQMIVKINEVLKARWRQIYKGSDIDYIELVDEEVTRGKEKKFNYYIAMRKNTIRMKMREKSSAGQKALASIILRMTLAELFVKDFSFIALDEPTANLDLANVKSLAKAIGGYVKRRLTKGMNIQWIIITHDEQFFKALDSECSPYYYKIEMDLEGCSKILKLSYDEISSFSVPSSLDVG